MSNAIYPLCKQTLLDPSHGGGGAGIDFNSDTIKIRLVTSTTVYNTAHQFLSDLAGSAVGTDQILTSPTVVDGVFDAADPTWPSVASGSTITALVVYKSTGTAATSDLIAWFDTDPSSNPISLVTNGSDVTFTFSTSGILAL